MTLYVPNYIETSHDREDSNFKTLHLTHAWLNSVLYNKLFVLLDITCSRFGFLEGGSLIYRDLSAIPLFVAEKRILQESLDYNYSKQLETNARGERMIQRATERETRTT